MAATARALSQPALPLALAFAALVVYASLYPFSGWRWPAPLEGAGLLRLPWPPWRDRFDEAANLLGYLPLGALLFGAVVRSGGSAGRRTGRWPLAGSAVLSFTVEVAAELPAHARAVAEGLALNVAGALVGALLAACCSTRGLG